MKTPEIEGILTLNIRIDTLLIENQQKEIKQLTEQLAASRAEAAQWKTELVKSSDEISQALERGWLNPVAAKNLTADLAAKERECERLRGIDNALTEWRRYLTKLLGLDMESTVDDVNDAIIDLVRTTAGARGALNTRLENAGIVLDFMMDAVYRKEDDCWVIKPLAAAGGEVRNE